MGCQVIRDSKKTEDSLQYAFIEFDKREDAEQVRFLSIYLKRGLIYYYTGILQNAKCSCRR
jgi:RNA recognition motif. (a.k.a. RRM, RBD, or RNP domain)